MRGDIVQKKVPVREIKWTGLYDKNSDKLYAPKTAHTKKSHLRHRKNKKKKL